MAAQPDMKAESGTKPIQDWLDYEYQGGYVELIEGELIVAGGATSKHQRLVSRYENTLNRLKPNGEVFIAPLGVKFDDDNIPEPDVFWIASDNPARDLSRYIQGVPNLIIEIISTGSKRRDQVDKFRVYQRFGVPEYWLVHPDSDVTEVYVLKDNKYALHGKFTPDESFDSPALGKTVDLKPIYAGLPSSPSPLE